jgi:hypothetical protein
MNTLNIKKFKELAKKNGELVISIYIPTSKQSTDSYQSDKIHFKNELKALAAELEQDYNIEVRDVKKILQPAWDLLDDYEFWKFNSEMLAYFIIDGEVELYRLSKPLAKSQHFISTRPFLLPIISELNDDGNYYLLSLDLEKIKLFKGSRNHIQEIPLDPGEIATSFTAEEELDENISSLQGQGGVGAAGAMYHGHGEGSAEEKKLSILNYFHRMTNMLEPKLNENPLPLYLAGVDYLIPIFHEASKYTHLQKGHLGSIQGLSMRELQEKGWELAKNYFSKESKNRKEDFGFKISRNLAISNDQKTLVKAAVTGGVDTLLVNNNHEHLLGKFDEKNYSVELGPSESGNTHCLIDLAAVKVIENGGKVFIVEPEDMPGEAPMAGTLRYEV